MPSHGKQLGQHGERRGWLLQMINGNREPFWKEVARPGLLLTMAALLWASGVLSHIWIFEYVGLLSIDAFERGQSPPPAQFCRIVRIEPDDYRNYFGKKSPLDSNELASVVGALLQLRPAVLVVDIDTSDDSFKERPIPAAGIPIVWAQDAREEWESPEAVHLKPLPILGRPDAPPGVCWGLAVYRRSLDWAVREYPRSIRIGTRYWPSLHWTATEAYRNRANSTKCQDAPNGRNSLGELSVPVFHSRYSYLPITLNDAVQWSNIAQRDQPGNTRKRSQSAAEVPPSASNALQGKIVFLGGDYSNSDTHPTPFGPIAGVELIANAVEAELAPPAARYLDSITKYGIKISLALLIVYVHWMFRPRFALILSLIVLGWVVFCGSFLAFYFSGYRANSVPFLIGILIEQLHHGSEHAERAHVRTLMHDPARTPRRTAAETRRVGRGVQKD